MTFGIKIVIKYKGKPKLIQWQKQTKVTIDANGTFNVIHKCLGKQDTLEDSDKTRCCAMKRSVGMISYSVHHQENLHNVLESNNIIDKLCILNSQIQLLG